MKNLVVRMGSWEHVVVVSFAPADEWMLEDELLTDGAQLAYAQHQDHGIVTIEGVDGGCTVRDLRRESGVEATTIFTREIDFQTANEGSSPFPRFALTEIDAILDVGRMTIRLPLIHDLPWPNIIGGYELSDPAKICEREFRVRYKSALLSKCEKFLFPLPKCFTNRLSGEVFGRIMREVREDVEKTQS